MVDTLFGIEVRESTAEHYDFLLGLYSKRRMAELSVVGWDEEEQNAFLKMQFDLRERAYRMRYQNTEFRTVFADGQPVGELITARSADKVFLVDVSVLREFKGRGIASRLIADLQDEAYQARKVIVLHVERANTGAKALYERLGFATVSEDHSLALRMEWQPSARD